MNYIIRNNQITFLDSRFYVNDDGTGWYPSVTTLLEAYPKNAAFYEWLKSVGHDADNIRDEAGRRGSTVHHLTELYDNGYPVSLINDDGSISYKLSEWAMFERYVELRNNHSIEIIHNELTLVSDKMQTGGTIDRIIDINGKRLVLDIKTSNQLYKHYWLQLAAYKNLYEEELGGVADGVAILWLNAKTRTTGRGDAIQGQGWQLITCTAPAELSTFYRQFEAAAALWRAEFGSLKPRQFSYSLTHKL